MKYSAMCEKAIVNEKGDIIVYQLICDISNDPQWQPYMVPSYSISRDKGSTWSNLRQIGTRRDGSSFVPQKSRQLYPH